MQSSNCRLNNTEDLFSYQTTGRHHHLSNIMMIIMISQLVPSIFPCSPLPSGTWRTPGLSIPWCCLPTSSSVCLVFYPLSLCLARWFWPDLMNRRHDHTAEVCSGHVSIQVTVENFSASVAPHAMLLWWSQTAFLLPFLPGVVLIYPSLQHQSPHGALMEGTLEGDVHSIRFCDLANTVLSSKHNQWCPVNVESEQRH